MNSYFLTLLGAILYAFGNQQAGWAGHDYSHHTVFKSIKLNHFFGYLYASVEGYDLYWWKARHNTHHVVTNEMHNDPDIKTSPVLTFFASTAQQLNIFQQMQSYYYVPLVSMLDLYWKFESIEYTFTRLPQHAIGSALLIVYWIFTVYVFYPLGFKAFMLCSMLKGLFTGLVVFATHYSEQRLEKDPKMSFAEQSSRTSRNISGGFFIDVFSGHISRQVTHHIFPMMPTSNLAKADKHVKALLSKHGLSLNESSFWECTVRCMNALKISDFQEVS
jgi:fatty acid desaturase